MAASYWSYLPAVPHDIDSGTLTPLLLRQLTELTARLADDDSDPA